MRWICQTAGWPAKLLRVTDPRSFGCGFAALGCIADSQSADRRVHLLREYWPSAANYKSAIRRSETEPQANTPSPPSDGGEGWGEEEPPLSSVLSPLLRRGERKKKSARQKSSQPATTSTDTDTVCCRRRLVQEYSS